jgi:hypothetical protein
MRRGTNLNISYSFIIFSAGWLVLVSTLWINYRQWITYDWGLPLLPWFIILIGVYNIESSKLTKRKKGRHSEIKAFRLKFWKDILSQSFVESWYGLRLEMVVVVSSSMIFALYYLFTI